MPTTQPNFQFNQWPHSMGMIQSPAEVYEFQFEGPWLWRARLLLTRLERVAFLHASGHDGRLLPLSQNVKNLTATQWQELDHHLADGFWNLPEHDDKFGLDGWTWTLSGWRGKRAHRVSRWSPSDDDFAQLGRFILHVAGLPMPEDAK